jgi:hypothetical protein
MEAGPSTELCDAKSRKRYERGLHFVSRVRIA